jgi:2-oxoglutarate dehydrogenase complex dehydrogenase (E1) component-like enzyme
MGQRIDELSFLNGTNANYIAELYARYREDADDVDKEWREVFDDLNDDAASILAELEPARAARRVQATAVAALSMVMTATVEPTVRPTGRRRRAIATPSPSMRWRATASVF